MYTDDPARDFAQWDMEQTMAEALLPVCDCCGEAIRDDFYWEIDGDMLCEKCMNSRYRKFTDNFIDNY